MEWVAISFSRGSSRPRDRTLVSCIAGRCFNLWANREAIMYGCEGWTIKKAEYWRTDVFELQCWRRLSRIPWTARRPNQSILKEISPEYSLEGLMLKLKLQYFGDLMRRADTLEKTLMLGKTEGRMRGDRGRDGWMSAPTQWTWVWASLGRWWRTGKPGVLQSTESRRVRHDWVTEQQQQHSVFSRTVGGNF